MRRTSGAPRTSATDRLTAGVDDRLDAINLEAANCEQGTVRWRNGRIALLAGRHPTPIKLVSMGVLSTSGANRRRTGPN